MRILHFIYDHVNNPWVGGGGAVRVHEIYRRLSARHSITVVSGRYPGAAHYQEGNLDYVFAGTAKNSYFLSTFSYALSAAKLLREKEGRFDVLVEDFAPYNPLFAFRRRRDAIVQVHQKEGIEHFKKHGVLGLPFFSIESFYPRLFRNFVTISDISRQKFRLRGEGVVIANGFDAELLHGAITEGSFILYLGRLHIDQKGLDVLRDAMKYNPFELRIAGGGKDEREVRDLFSELTGSGLVKMTGFVRGEEKADLLRTCKILILPSRYEGQPLTLIEAAACGKPVIVSDISELSYAVDAGFGLSFKTGDAKDLAQKIAFLLGNRSVRLEMGRRGREYARKFTWDTIAAEYERFLMDIVTAGPGRK
jgi:glycogen synthase